MSGPAAIDIRTIWSVSLPPNYRYIIAFIIKGYEEGAEEEHEHAKSSAVNQGEG